MERLAKVERAVSRNSGKSSMPPSADDLPGRTAPETKPGRGNGKKKQGKQPPRDPNQYQQPAAGTPECASDPRRRRSAQPRLREPPGRAPTGCRSARQQPRIGYLRPLALEPLPHALARRPLAAPVAAGAPSASDLRLTDEAPARMSLLLLGSQRHRHPMRCLPSQRRKLLMRESARALVRSPNMALEANAVRALGAAIIARCPAARALVRQVAWRVALPPAPPLPFSRRHD